MISLTLIGPWSLVPDGFEYFRNCWSPVSFIYNSLQNWCGCEHFERLKENAQIGLSWHEVYGNSNEHSLQLWWTETDLSMQKTLNLEVNGLQQQKTTSGSFPLQLSSLGECVLMIASNSYPWMTGMESDLLFCCYSPSTSRFDVLWVLRAQHNCRVLKKK